MEMMNDYLARVKDASKGVDSKDVQKMLDVLEKAYYQRKQVLILGNGGSGATASHFSEDLAKGTLNGNINSDVNRFKAISLTDNVPFILALANDEGYHSIFEQQLRTYGEKGDVVIAISGSGNSENVLNAVRYANYKKMITIGMTGFDGGKLRKLAMHCVHVPIDDMGITEAVHGIILHYVVDYLKDRLNSNIKYIEKVTSVFAEDVEKNRMVKSEVVL